MYEVIKSHPSVRSLYEQQLRRARHRRRGPEAEIDRER
jgi:hypothetical protein